MEADVTDFTPASTNLVHIERSPTISTSSLAAGFGTVCPRLPLTVTFDRLTLKLVLRVASKVENHPTKFGHARPLRSRIIRYVRDGRIDRQTDRRTDGQKQRLLPPSVRSGHNNT